MDKPFRTTIGPTGDLDEATSAAILSVTWDKTALSKPESRHHVAHLARHESELARLIAIPRGNDMDRSTADELYSRIVAEADKEGMVWTPLIDALARAPEIYVHTWKTEGLRERAEHVKPWISSASGEEATAALHVFRSGLWREMVASSTNLEALSNETLAELRKSEQTLKAMLDNPTMNSAISGTLFTDMTEKWPKADINGQNKFLKPFLEMLDRFGDFEPQIKHHGVEQLISNIQKNLGVKDMWMTVRDLRNTLKRIASTPTSEATLEALLDAETAGEAVHAAVLMNPSLPAHRRSLAMTHIATTEPGRAWTLLTTMIREPVADSWQPDGAIIGAYARWLNERQSWNSLIALMDHSWANDSVWQVAYGNDRPEVKSALARSPLAERPDVQEWLLSSSSPEVMAALLGRVKDKHAWSRLFDKLLKKKSSIAIDLLAEISIPEGAVIDSERILAELGTLADAERRQKVLLGISRTLQAPGATLGKVARKVSR